VRSDVEFVSDGITLRGHFYAPEGEGPWPTVVMAGGWCYVKELVQPDYARMFAAAGVAALVFDYRNFGDSEGEPRQHIDPNEQIEDYRNAISYLETRHDVDSNRLAIWGISYSGGHALVIGATDPRIRCVVSNIPVVDGLLSMKLAHGSLGFRKLEDAVIEDRRKRYGTGEHGYIPMSSRVPHEELVTWPFPEVTSGFEMLKEREAPNHEHRNTIASVENLMNYSVEPYVKRIIDTPTLMTVAERDDITTWEEEVRMFNLIPTTKKRLYIFPDTSHMTLYSDKSRLEIAAEQGRDWLVEHLITPYA
jgi:fermentation-respiration switch protein FrsA (DUF1100 family)